MSGWERKRSLADAHHRQPEQDRVDFGSMPPYNTPRVSEPSAQGLEDAAKEGYSRGDTTTCLSTVKYQKIPPPAAARQHMASAGFQFDVPRPGWTSAGAQQRGIPPTLLSSPNRGGDMLSGLRSGVANSPNTLGMSSSSFPSMTSEPDMLGTPASPTPYGSQQRRDTGLKTTPGDFESSDPVARSGLLSGLRGLTLTSSLPEPHKPVLRNGKFVEE
ncbi:MAG: hypothetical protein M1840_004011 [Geoglossum simile]|nr:MAG: hypothetical protein M1840_004011 [Geoglossum simile]